MRYLYFLLICIITASCGERLEGYLPTEKFKTIFADAGQGIDYQPIDVIQTEDNGYLILAEGALNSVFVMKVDSRGQMQWTNTLPAIYENPVGEIVLSEGKYYFIAANSVDQTVVLIEVDDLNQEVLATDRSYAGYRIPLAFGRYDTDNYLMLTYNDTIGPILSKLQAGFAMEWARSFDNTGSQAEAVKTAMEGRNFNFLLGSINNGQILYFNSLREGGNTLTFTNSLGIETGKISSEGSGEIISYNYLGNLVSAINYSNGEHSFFQISHPLNADDSIDINEIAGLNTVDLAQNANAITVNSELVATGQLINFYETPDNRIKWINYSVGSNNINAIDYVGGQDPLGLVKAIDTRDGGILILASVLLGGARSRISIQKIPALELRGAE